MANQTLALRPRMMQTAVERIEAMRGQARQFWRTFDRSLVPMVTVDSQQRYQAANAAARLVSRRSLEDWRRRRIEDLTPSHMTATPAGRWAQLMRGVAISGRCDFERPDGSQLTTDYSALANVLPGQHLIVFVPADWPDDELCALIGEEAPLPRGLLTRREVEVLTLIATGANLYQIADELTISVYTVRTHAGNACNKLGARNRAHAITLAMQHSLIDVRLAPVEEQSSD